MFERKNQNILSEHFTKLVDHAGDGAGSDSDDDGDDDDDAPTLLNNAAGPASPSFPQFRPGAGPGTDGSNNVTDITPYKKCVLSRPVLYIPPSCPPPRGLRE